MLRRGTTGSTEYFSAASSPARSSPCNSLPSPADSVDSEQLEALVGALSQDVALQQQGADTATRALGFHANSISEETLNNEASSLGREVGSPPAAGGGATACQLPPVQHLRPQQEQHQQQVDVIELLDSDTESDESWRIGSAMSAARKRQVVVSSDSDSDPSPPRPKEAKSKEGPVSNQRVLQQQQQQQASELPAFFAAIPGLQVSAAALAAARPRAEVAPRLWQQQPQQPVSKPAAVQGAQEQQAQPSSKPAAVQPTQNQQKPPATQQQQPASKATQQRQQASGQQQSQPKSQRAPWRHLSLSDAAFKKQRDALSQQMFEEYNRVIFEGRLPSDLQIKWNNRLATTAGLTHYKRELPADRSQPNIYTAHVELGSKVLDEVSKLERTLCHELCHVAAWLVNHTAKPPHGPIFKAWADRAMYFYPHLDITTCHQYDIFYPFRWQCSNAECLQEYGRHSNSIDVMRKVCGECRGRLVFLGKFSRDGSPAKQRQPSAFAAYVKTNYAVAKQQVPAGTPQAEVMKRLGRDWAAKQAGAQGAAAGDGSRESSVVNLLDGLNLAG